jgi:hypothetical protein
MQADVERVLQEHSALTQASSHIESILIAGADRDCELFASLSQYATLLAEHLLGEHDVLQGAANRRGGHISGYATTMLTELDALRSDWEEYLTIWNEEKAADDWPSFAEQSAAILARIRRRIQRENELLLSLSAAI